MVARAAQSTRRMPCGEERRDPVGSNRFQIARCGEVCRLIMLDSTNSLAGEIRMTDIASAKERLVSLDLLRCLAVVLVLGRHFWVSPAAVSGPLRTLLTLWQRGGWIGVDLFFVLSGFLVSGLLFREYRRLGSIRIVHFYVRRAWKIYPPFYVLMAVTCVAVAVLRLPYGYRNHLAEFFFVQNYVPGIWGHTWSLAVEEHFYFVLPLMLGLFLQRRTAAIDPFRGVPWLACFTVCGCLGLRLLNSCDREQYSHLTHLFPTHLRIDALLFGVAISYYYHFHEQAFTCTVTPNRFLLLLAGVGLLSSAFIFELETVPWISTFGLTLFLLGSGALLVGFLATRIPVNWLTVSASKIGMHSYSIYLWHMPVAWFLPQVNEGLGLSLGPAALLGCYIFDSVVFGILMAHLIEFPALRIRDRLFPFDK